ncbi:MAG: DMT family transporter [candidate division WOR-3 bacterium]
MSERRAILYVVLSSLIWSTSFPAVKLGLSYFSPLTFVFLRFLLGFLIYLIFFQISKSKFPFNLFKEKGAYLLGFVTFLSYVFQFVGQKYTLASRTALIINLFVIWVPILAVIFLKEKFHRKYLVSLFLLVPGMILLSGGRNLKQAFAQGLMLGDLIVLIASFCWAFYVITSKKLLEKYSSHEINAFVFLVTTVLAFPFTIHSNFKPVFNIAGLGIVLHLSLNCTVLAYYLYVTGLKHSGAIKSTIFVSLEVLFSFIVSLIVLGERWTAVEILGGFLMLTAVFLSI